MLGVTASSSATEILSMQHMVLIGDKGVEWWGILQHPAYGGGERNIRWKGGGERGKN